MKTIFEPLPGLPGLTNEQAAKWEQLQAIVSGLSELKNSKKKKHKKFSGLLDGAYIAVMNYAELIRESPAELMTSDGHEFFTKLSRLYEEIAEIYDRQ